jgi:hypothetical protein
MPKALKATQTPELGAQAPQAEGSDPFGPPKPSSLRELAKRGRRFRGKKPLQEAFAEALNDLFDAYLYTLYHPCDISPHELIALINAHLEVMAAQKEAYKAALRADIEAQKEALWLEVERKLLAKAQKGKSVAAGV